MYSKLDDEIKKTFFRDFQMLYALQQLNALHLNDNEILELPAEEVESIDDLLEGVGPEEYKLLPVGSFFMETKISRRFGSLFHPKGTLK